MKMKMKIIIFRVPSNQLLVARAPWKGMFSGNNENFRKIKLWKNKCFRNSFSIFVFIFAKNSQWKNGEENELARDGEFTLKVP